MVVTDLDLRQAIIATGWAWRVRDQATQVEMLLVPPGTFQMGCSRSMQHPCFNGELPVHEVTLTNPFYVGRYEITQAQWQAVAGSNPSFFRSPSSAVPASQVPWRPVESVSFTAVQSFLETTGMRLLTEAEWEYACRAGTQAAFSNGSDDDSTVPPIAWFQSGSLDQTRPVGLKAANGLGLHDMQGNVWEWVSDRWGNYSESAQTNPTGPASGPPLVRGGGYLDIVREMRSSTRAWYTNGSSGSHSSIGFRVARNP
jgi:formylglycine-generating enzyme required for sulfatase activity